MQLISRNVILPISMAILVLALLITTPVRAEENHPTAPHLSSMHLWLDLDLPPCIERVTAALTSAGLLLHEPVDTARGASNEKLFALVTCIPDEKRTLVTVTVAGIPGSKNEAARMLEFLGEYMRTGKAPAGNAVPISNQHITLAKATFFTTEDIEVQWTGLPGSPGPRGDWITIVPAGSPDDTWGNWWYTESKKAGSGSAGKLDPGNYEIRVYFNYPAGGYTVQSRLPFTVVTPSGAGDQSGAQQTASNQHITLAKSTFSSTEEILVQWTGFPGSPGPRGDWITIVPAGSPDDTWGNWWYTESKKAGLRSAGKLDPGNYEVRVYFNYPADGYTVQSRLPFTVQ